MRRFIELLNTKRIPISANRMATRVFWIILFVNLVSLSLFVGSGYVARMIEEKDEKHGVKVSDLPKVNERFFTAEWDGPPQYKVHILDTNNYSVPELQIHGCLNSNLIVTVLETIRTNSPRVQLWVKAETLFIDLWQSIELFSTQVDWFSLALFAPDSAIGKNISQKWASCFEYPEKNVYSGRFAKLHSIEVSTNMIVVGYGKNHLSVNNSSFSLDELKSMNSRREKPIIVLLVSGDSSVQDAVNMMVELRRRYCEEYYFGLMPKRGSVQSGSVIQVVKSDSW